MPEITPSLNHALALERSGRTAEACAALESLADADRADAAVFYHLGRLRHQRGETGVALRALLFALRAAPDHFPSRFLLGQVFRDQQLLDQAIDAFSSAVKLRPEAAAAHQQLAYALKDAGRWPEAMVHNRQAIALAPDDAVLHGDLIAHLSYQPGITRAEIHREQSAWNARHAARLMPVADDHANPRLPGRRLRIAYLSPYLRQHAEASFLAPVLHAHDRESFEIHCYSTSPGADSLTATLRSLPIVWHESAALEDEPLARQIRADGIDVLVDTCLHYDGGRLLACARRPAPVQLTWLALLDADGLDFFDHRIGDPILDADPSGPPRALTLPTCAVVFEPQGDYPEVSPLPAARHGATTFGCLNHFQKVHPSLLRTWARILAAVPDSRLLLTCPPGSARDRVHALFAEGGVEPARVRFADFLPLAQYRAFYGRIDLALDPFPYNGCMTTCDALWMGVPVVTLAGSTLAGRVGASLLANATLPECIASSPEDYVQRAVSLASDHPRLAELRAGLRARLRQSPLLDTRRFTRELEAAYRSAWHRWCEG